MLDDFFLGAIYCFPLQSFLKGQCSNRISPFKKGFSLQSGLGQIQYQKSIAMAISIININKP